MVRARRSYSALSLRPIAPGVGTDPGATAFTRTPRGPSSAASVFVSVTIAPFTRLYTAVFGKPRSATGEAMLIDRAAALGIHVR